jgi:hypothetical protein
MGFVGFNGGEKRLAGASFPLTEAAPDPAAIVFVNRRELKVREVKVLSIIDQLKKTLLQLELMELRCRELLVSIVKALEAFSYEFKAVKRKIYPFSIFSRIRKSVRSFRSGVYYTPGDLRELAALGSLTVNIVNMVETPVF